MSPLSRIRILSNQICSYPITKFNQLRARVNGERIIQISCLGENGGFGNQLFQYAFAKAYAEKYDCTLEVPSDWLGRKFFKISDKSISRKLPRTKRDEIPFGEVNIDLFGFFQHQKFLDIMDPSKVKQWFSFKSDWSERFKRPREFYIAIHLRHGDYVNRNDYCTISEDCYIDFCNKSGYDIQDLIVVSQENKQPGDPGNMLFLHDFFLLMEADILLRSNSTFSWWAGFLGNQQLVYSPLVQGKSGQHGIEVDFVKGNHPCHMEIDNRHSDLYL